MRTIIFLAAAAITLAGAGTAGAVGVSVNANCATQVEEGAFAFVKVAQGFDLDRTVAFVLSVPGLVGQPSDVILAAIQNWLGEPNSIVGQVPLNGPTNLLDNVEGCVTIST